MEVCSVLEVDVNGEETFMVDMVSLLILKTSFSEIYPLAPPLNLWFSLLPIFPFYLYDLISFLWVKSVRLS